MEDYLILLQAKLDEAKSKKNIEADIDKLQKQLNKLKIQVKFDPKAAQKLADNIGKLLNQNIVVSNIKVDANSSVAAGQNYAKQFNQGVTKEMSSASKTTGKVLRDFSELNDLSYAGQEKIDVAFGKEFDKSLSNLSKLKEKWQEQGIYVDEFKLKVESLENSLNEISIGDVKGLNSFKEQISSLSTEAKQLSNELTGQTWFQNLGDKIKQLMTYLSDTTLTGKLLQTGKQIIDNVLKIDVSLVELEKVSDLTTEGLEKVTDKAFELGKSLSRTGTDVLDSVAYFKRAGYDIADSLEYAEEALKTTNISENLKDSGQAADSLVNIMKGFRDESPDFARKINDAVNQVSNTEAVDFDNLIDGATRLSAVADQAGMSFEQMLGTLTGGYEILGNMEKVATGQITIFSRLQAIQLDGEEEVSTVAKLQETFSNATKGAVNIVDQTTGQLRNVYDILDDIANVWDNLDKSTREALAIEASGIRQKNVFLAMMQNWDGVKDAVESASNSFGSADVENEKYIKSIQGRVNNFERSIQQLSRTVLDSDIIKFFVDLGTTGINAIDKIVNKFSSLETIWIGSGLFAGIKNVGKDKMYSSTFIVLNMPTTMCVL